LCVPRIHTLALEGLNYFFCKCPALLFKIFIMKVLNAQIIQSNMLFPTYLTFCSSYVSLLPLRTKWVFLLVSTLIYVVHTVAVQRRIVDKETSVSLVSESQEKAMQLWISTLSTVVWLLLADYLDI